MRALYISLRDDTGPTFPTSTRLLRGKERGSGFGFGIGMGKFQGKLGESFAWYLEVQGTYNPIISVAISRL